MSVEKLIEHLSDRLGEIHADQRAGFERVHDRLDSFDSRLRAIETSRVRTDDLELVRANVRGVRSDLKALSEGFGAFREEKAHIKGKIAVIVGIVGAAIAVGGVAAKFLIGG